MSKARKIGTHNGTFHCDDALACFLLKLLPEFKDAEIVRTRDPGLLGACDAVVDVGGVFDPTTKRFDHHQGSFKETMHSLRPELKWEIRLSSAGLVYCHFGEQIISDIIKQPISDANTQLIFRKTYEHFIMEIDAIDNGVNMFDGEPRYNITTNLSARVGYLNPKWNEEQSAELMDERFQTAMKLTGTEFLDRVNYYKNTWLSAKALVKEAIEKRREVHESGAVIEFRQGGCPWTEHLFDIEEEMGIQGELKYVLYPDLNGQYRVQCVPVKLKSFDSRLPLPWKGLRDDELSRESGIPGCIFVHASGFIGGNKTRDGALEMIKAAFKMESQAAK